MRQLSNLELFGVGAAVGGTVGLGLSLFVRYVVIPNLFASQPTLASLSTPSPAPFQPIPAPATAPATASAPAPAPAPGT